MGLETVLKQVEDERKLQDHKWGGAQHDDEHTSQEFCEYIKNYASWASQMADMCTPYKARKRLIQVAALAVAAVESIDRENQLDVRRK